MKVHKDGWNVVTPQRRDVGSTNIKVNKRQRRDVSTSQRFKVSASSASPSLKAERGPEFGALGIVRTRAQKSEQP